MASYVKTYFESPPPPMAHGERKRRRGKYFNLNISKTIMSVIRTRSCAHQGVRKGCFSENLACFVFLKYPFWDEKSLLDEKKVLFKTYKDFLFAKYGNSNVLIDLAQLQVFNEASLGLIIRYDPVLRLERRWGIWDYKEFDISN